MDTPNEIDNVYLARLYLRPGTGFGEQIKLCVLITNKSAFVRTSRVNVRINHENYEGRISQILINSSYKERALL